MYLHKLLLSQRIEQEWFQEIPWTLRRVILFFFSKYLLKTFTQTLKITPCKSLDSLVQQWLKGRHLKTKLYSVLNPCKWMWERKKWVVLAPVQLFLQTCWLDKLAREFHSPKQDCVQSTDLPCPGNAVAHDSQRHVVIKPKLRTTRKWHCSNL